MTVYQDADLQEVMGKAMHLAREYHHEIVTAEHCFVAMITTPCKANPRLKDFTEVECREWLKNTLTDIEGKPGDETYITQQLDKLIQQAAEIAYQKGRLTMDSVDLLVAMLNGENSVQEKVKKKGWLLEDFITGPPPMMVHIDRKHFAKPSLWSRLIKGQRAKAGKLRTILEHAHELWSNRQYDDCIIVCEEGLAISPTMVQLQQLRAYSFLQKQDYDKAVRYLKALQETDPDNTNYRISLAYALDMGGKETEASGILEQLEQELPDDATILNNRGFNLHLLGKHAEAVPYYEKAIAMEPEFAYPYNNLGFARYKLGFKEEGLQLIDQSLTLDKGNSYAYMFKGRIYLETGEYAKAREQFDLALRYGFTKQYGNEVLELMKELPVNR